MSELLGEARLGRLLDACLDLDGAAAVQASVHHSWGGLTRYADSVIHQHVASEHLDVVVSAVTPDGRRGFASGTALTPEEARRTATAALEAARLSPPDPDFPGFAARETYPEFADSYDESTAIAGPHDRAEAVVVGLRQLGADQRAAGSLQTRATEAMIATTEGARGYATLTSADYTVAVRGANGGTAFETDGGTSLSHIDTAARGRTAATTCTAAENPGPVDVGVYEVVLRPAAVFDLAMYLGLMAFDGKAVEDGRSALCGRLGTQVASPLVTIRDDAGSPGIAALPFDGEAMPKSAVDLVVNGVATGIVHNRETARRAGVRSTGHGAGSPDTGPSMGVGAAASHLVVSPGDSSVDELVAGVERGLLVTRFWYTRIVDPMRTLLTGMTRDGTFLIEDGQIVRSVRNLRWNESILDLLSNCTGVGAEQRSIWSMRLPALRCSKFTCTAVTEH